jgi:hypothetical protein
MAAVIHRPHARSFRPMGLQAPNRHVSHRAKSHAKIPEPNQEGISLLYLQRVERGRKLYRTLVKFFFTGFNFYPQLIKSFQAGFNLYIELIKFFQLLPQPRNLKLTVDMFPI